ncbi:MAG: hypothetical protein Q9187_004938 [Circinaria calcarea]
MKLWTGNIGIGEEGPQDGLHDLHFYDQHPSSRISFDSAVSFSFLSFVEIASIPLHAFVGPLLNVYSGAASTEAWLSDCLLRDICEDRDDNGDSGGDGAPWWSRSCGQSNLGILLKVDGEIKISGFGYKIREVLLYAALPELPFYTRNAPPTPPRSSSPNGDWEPHSSSVTGEVQTARIVARLVSSDLFYAASQKKISSLSETPSGYAQFVAPSPEINSNQQPFVQKRQRLESLFDDASRQNKKARRRGGESVAKAMATADVASSVLQERIFGTSLIDKELAGFPPVRMEPPERPHQLSRSQSLGSMHDLDAIGPGNRAGVVAARKPSSLHRVASLAALDSSSPASETNRMEQQNKAALTRVIMAGMRLFGLEPRRKASHSRAASESLTSSAMALVQDQPSGDEHEYKLIYHQTYKAASFVFRHQMAVLAISQDMMRDTVDHLLAMFCNDPVQTPLTASNIGQTFGSEDRTAQCVFDSSSIDLFPD